MITDADIIKIETRFREVFATKEELGEVRLELGEVHDTIDTMASAIGRIENTLDKFTGAIHDQQVENAAGAVHLTRHDRQIEALALAANIALPN